MNSEIDAMECELKAFNELNVQIYNQITDLMAKSKTQPHSSNQSEVEEADKTKTQPLPCNQSVEQAEIESNVDSGIIFVENGVC